MNLLSDLKTILSALEIPVETGVFSDQAPDRYLVLVPLDEEFGYFADDLPCTDVQRVRMSLYTKGNYLKLKNRVIRSLLNADMTITDRRYLGFEPDTKYHHYNIDVENVYETEE